MFFSHTAISSALKLIILHNTDTYEKEFLYMQDNNLIYKVDESLGRLLYWPGVFT
jgi:hypothetical protein